MRRRRVADPSALDEVRAGMNALEHAQTTYENTYHGFEQAMLNANEQGWTIKQIAEVTGLSWSSVHRAIVRAEQRMTAA